MSLSPVVRWLLTFAGFPLGASGAGILAGPVDDAVAASLGGAITGLVLGAAQGWALFGRNRRAVEWAVCTALGLAAGLAVGATLVDFRTGLTDLAAQGALTGAGVGLAQAALIRSRVAAAWPAYLAGVWSLGWVITASIGVDVDDQYTVFGSSGAAAATVLTAVLPLVLRRAEAVRS